MKKIVISILTVFSFLYSSQVVIELQDADFNNENIRVNSSDIFSSNLIFELDDFNIIEVDDEDGKVIRLSNGAQILKQGAPDLPKKTASIIIPDDQKMEIVVKNSEFTEYTNFEILPSKGNLSRLVNPDDIPFEYGNEYLNNEFYPGNLAELGNPYILRDVRGISVITYPIQYNPVSKVLRVYNSIEVEIKSTGRDIENILSHENKTDKRSFEFENIYNSHFINSQNDLRFDYVVDHGNMLIICNEAFLSTMEPFVEWKTYKGIPVEMVGVSEAGGSATSIKNYITNYYNTHGLTFVLLVGDEGQVPSIYVSGSASDPSYGFIVGNDSYSEVIVGRFSGQNPSQIATQVERSIDYERFPTNGSWYQKALGIASNQGPGMNGYSDDDFNDWLWNSILSQYHYNDYDGIYDSNGGSVTEGVNAINNGASIVNYTGHGSISSWGNGAPLSTSNVNSLTNNGELPFVITVGCNVGEFQSTNECFSEAWQRSTHNGQPSGAIANMGSTISQSWEPPMHGQWAMNKILTESFDGVSGNGETLTRTLGGIATNGCLHMNDAQGGSGINETNYWTFFGDPTINVRTMAPTNLIASYESTIIIGQENFTVNTGFEGDLVALSRNGELLVSGYTNSNGNANLNIGSVSSIPGAIDIVISSYNKYVYENELMVISPEGAYLILDNYTTNNEVTFGSNIGLSLQFSNVGSDPANNTQLEILSNDEFVEINNSILNLGNISNNQTVVSTEIELNVSPNVPDGHHIQFEYSINSGGDVWTGEFSLIASAPQLEVTDILIDANCGTLLPGGTGSVEVTIQNIGSTALPNPITEIFTNGNSTIDNSYSDNVGSLFGNESLNISFDISIANGIQLGSNLYPQVYVSSTDVEGFNIPINFDLFVGVLIENFETGDFSCHNWNNLGINSWTVTSNSSSGGEFSAVSAQIGDNQTSSLSITMDVTDEGTLEFDYRVSAEYSTSGDYFYDGLEFYIDGILMDQFQSNTDGTSPWNFAQYDIPAGQHDFVWTFVKDGAGGSTDCISTNCDDAAFIDNLKFPFSEPDGISGDINNDGVINVLDVVQTVALVLDEGYNSYADVNNDGAVNVLDIVQIVNLILEQ